MDFDVVDEVVRVSDRECFQYTRRLVREEGILAGGSSGGALCGAIKYAERIDKPINMVVIMCDSFSRYMSKIFDDEWMRENGFMDTDLGHGTVADMMVAVGATKRKVIATRLGQKVQDVIEMMKLHGISQLPVMDGDRVVGVVAENDVLNHLLAKGHGNDPIDLLAEANFAIVEPLYSVNIVGQFFKQNKTVFVVDSGKLLSILTKIDFIDYVSR